MGDIPDRYRRISTAFAKKIEGVPADRWTAPTPCADWTVRDLVRHVVEMNGVHLVRLGRRLNPGPSADDDPLGAFDAIRAQVLADLIDPARAEEEFDGPFGRCTFAQAIDQSICFELLVHGWDLARASGQDERIDPADLTRMWETIELAGADIIRGSGVFGPAGQPSRGASEQARLLTHLGRQV